jgi:prepilin-type N-terminal cleavage/methylation domain-containing protein
MYLGTIKMTGWNADKHCHSKDVVRRRTAARLRRSGVTLVELLVVVLIGSLLLATAVPLLRTSIDENKVREASRQVSIFFVAARARAVETGRAVGVMIERSDGNPNAAFVLNIVETPPPYGGDTLSARVLLHTDSMRPWRIEFDNSSLTLPALVQAGDVIKFDYKGPVYRIVNVSSLGGSPWVDIDSGSPPLPANTSDGLPYQIIRQPVKSSASPLQLAGNVAIDLEYSGIGRFGTQFNAAIGTAIATNPVVISFNSSGAIDHVKPNGAFDGSGNAKYEAGTAVGTIHLLIGRIDQVGIDVADSPAEPNPIFPNAGGSSATKTYRENIADVRNLWISMGVRTGSVTSSENGWRLMPVTRPNFRDSFIEAREFAHSAQTIGGR